MTTLDRLKWRTLKVWCRDGGHPEHVGRFQRDDEYVELPNGAGSSGESWRQLTRQYDGGFHFAWLVWRCETCGKDTLHDPKGVTVCR